jgi:hypothetical protein
MTFLADEGALRQMEEHPVEPSSFDVSNKRTSTTSRYVRTARSETTFAGDYCCMMGNWTLQTEEEQKVAMEGNGGKTLPRPRHRSF